MGTEVTQELQEKFQLLCRINCTATSMMRWSFRDMQHFLAVSCTLERHPELFSWPQKTVVISSSFKLLRFGNHVMAINSQSTWEVGEGGQ